MWFCVGPLLGPCWVLDGSLSCDVVLSVLSSFAIILLRKGAGCFNPLYSRNPYMSTFASSEDPDEMQHNAAFHQGLHCL